MNILAKHDEKRYKNVRIENMMFGCAQRNDSLCTL